MFANYSQHIHICCILHLNTSQIITIIQDKSIHLNDKHIHAFEETPYPRGDDCAAISPPYCCWIWGRYWFADTRWQASRSVEIHWLMYVSKTSVGSGTYHVLLYRKTP